MRRPTQKGGRRFRGANPAEEPDEEPEISVTKAVAAAIQKIEKRQGRLKPDDVVKAAARASSPLHDFFTWDDSEAAEKQRLNEARRLIRSVKLVITTNTITFSVPKYLRDPAAAAAREQGYVRIETARTSEDMSREIAVREFERARSALARAQSVSQFLGMDEVISKIIVMVDDVLREAAAARQPGNA